MPTIELFLGLNDWWVMYAVAGIGYLLLILFVYNSKARAQSAPSTLGEPLDFTGNIAKEINAIHVQQFLANEITRLRTFLHFRDKLHLTTLPALNSAFPRRVRDDTLPEEELEATIDAVALNTQLNKSDIVRHINQDRDVFLETQQRLPMNGDFQKLDISKVVVEIENQHPNFNAFEILHKDGLRRICDGEGLKLLPFQKMELLAGVIQYEDSYDKSNHHAIMVNEGADVHPALEEFVLAHELGHWFAHIKNRSYRNVDYANYYLHSFHDAGPFENEADKVAMIALFPTPYLSWRDVLGNLNVDFLFEEFTSNRGWPAVTNKLAKIMRANINRRITSYHNYRNLKLQQLNLGNDPLRQGTIEQLRHDVLKERSWARLDENDIVVDANEKYSALLGMSVEELLKRKYHICDDLTAADLQPDMRKQLEEKRRSRQPKFYITRYKNPITNEEIPVAIYAFPIINDANQYVGAFGVVTDVRRGV
ncbi:MAG TPA: PAS domain-containing protein [Pyrinomonadaceae bacterium]|jgi:PAS domain S-box-containing protein|nr:PAS domain-containing protein [Pyrinomonadaceae bacterium]